MSTNNALLNEISSVDEIRRFSEALKKNRSSSLVLTGPAARGYFIAAISLTNKLVVVSDDAFGLYHESLGAKPLSFDYIPAEDSSDVVPKMFNYAFDRIRPYPILIQDKNPNVIYTEHNLDSHVAAPEPSGDDKLNSLSVNENIKIKDIINALNARGYIESQEAKFFGEYARRGGIIDVFPPNTNNPARIELYGDCIKSIRFYNPTSQLSIGQVDRVYIPELNPTVNKLKSISYGDLLLNIAQFEHFDWISRADIEPSDTIESRKTIFELIVNKNLVVAGSHFASGFGTLDHIDGQYQWRSVEL